MIIIVVVVIHQTQRWHGMHPISSLHLNTVSISRCLLGKSRHLSRIKGITIIIRRITKRVKSHPRNKNWNWPFLGWKGNLVLITYCHIKRIAINTRSTPSTLASKLESGVIKRAIYVDDDWDTASRVCCDSGWWSWASLQGSQHSGKGTVGR